jgi:hypothetical protein
MKLPSPGYHIFFAVVVEDSGMERCATELEEQIKEAEKEFDMVFLSGPSFKDAPSAGRNVYFGSQGAVLTKKGK